MSVSTKKYKNKHCEKCGTSSDITRDHIIPKWFERRFKYFQFEVYMVNNDQYLCESHNLEKGGIIDYKDERVRRFLRRFIEMIDDKIREAEKGIRIEKMKATIEAKKTEKKKKENTEIDDVNF